MNSNEEIYRAALLAIRNLLRCEPTDFDVARACIQSTYHMANIALSNPRETTAPPPCVWRDGCRNPPICVAKGCCHPPEMQRADSHDDLLRAVRYLIVCARTSGEKRDDGLCTALDRVESILQDRYCVTGCGEVSGVKFHSLNCPRSAVKTGTDPAPYTIDKGEPLC